jgi:chromosome segregation ATPase
MEKDLEQVEEHIHHIEELSGSSEQAAGDVHSAMIEMNNAVGTFDVNHSVFVKRRKEQDEMIMEIVESNKHFTTPMKYLTELPANMREDYKAIGANLAAMKEASHHMSVVSLDAAIEASRMGTEGARLVAAIEDVRVSSGRYEKAAKEISDRIDTANARMDELEEQVRRLNELIKENNISMSRLMQNGMQGMASYEAGQLDLRGILSDSSIGKTDALQLSEREINKILERMTLQMGDIKDEFAAQGEHISWLDELLEKDSEE